MWMFEAAIIFELGITLVYWTMLHDPTEPFSWSKLEHICIHSLPMALLTLDFFMQRWVFRYNHVVIMFMIGIPYLFVNYYWTVNHWTIYPMLTWDDIGSVIFVLLYIILTYMSFVLLYLFTRLNVQMKKPSEANIVNQNKVVLIPVNFESKLL